MEGKSELLETFLGSRREGISPLTMDFYRSRLEPFIKNYDLTPSGIRQFLANLKCVNGKHAYFRAIRAFCNFLFRQGYFQYNPILRVDPPRTAKAILPSLSTGQLNYLIQQASSVRDRAIISLLADSGLRLNELANVKYKDIDWENLTVTTWGKGHKQRKAPFTQRTADLLKEHVPKNGTASNMWGITRWGIVSMLRRLKQKTGLPCNCHSFRRTFASNLHRAGMDIEHIMRLGGWESLDMVIKYTSSVRFEDSLRHYRALMTKHPSHILPKTGS